MKSSELGEYPALKRQDRKEPNQEATSGEAKSPAQCDAPLPRDTLKRRVSLIEHVFLQYGAGAKVFKPLTGSPLWNRICWALIVMGIIGWLAAFWLLRGLSE